jgi:hypothetical protein
MQKLGLAACRDWRVTAPRDDGYRGCSMTSHPPASPAMLVSLAVSRSNARSPS